MKERMNRLSVPVDDPEVPTAPEKALPVRAVPQEYAYVAKILCTCGAAGRIEVHGQALLRSPEGWMDQLNARCEACGAEYTLYFDVSAVFEQYGRRFAGDQDPGE